MDYERFHRDTNIINMVGGIMTAINQLLLAALYKDDDNIVFGIMPLSVTGVINFVRKLTFITSDGFDEEEYRAAGKKEETKSFGVAAVIASCAALAATIYCMCVRNKKCED